MVTKMQRICNETIFFDNAKATVTLWCYQKCNNYGNKASTKM